MIKEYRSPTGSVLHSAGWTIFPADGVLWSKVDDGIDSNDGDSTYIEANDVDQWVKFTFPHFSLPLVSGPVYIKVHVTAKKVGGDCNLKEGFGYGELDGCYSDWQPLALDYATKSWECTHWAISGEPITVSMINNTIYMCNVYLDSIGGRITNVWIEAGIEPTSPRRTKPIEDINTLEAIRQMEMEAMSRFFISEEGKATYRSRFARSG